ncbi:MAG: hypothetical protein ACI8R9_001327 [Paraglaciecola sp.]
MGDVMQCSATGPGAKIGWPSLQQNVELSLGTNNTKKINNKGKKNDL